MGKKPVEVAKPSAPVKDETFKGKQLFLDFLGYDNPPKDAVTTATPNDSMLFNSLGNPIAPKKSSAANGLNYFLTEDATTRKLAAYSNPYDSYSSLVPKLRFNPCIRPPLQPSAHRARTLWYLYRTPEVIDDFRIEQVKNILYDDGDGEGDDAHIYLFLKKNYR